MLQRDRTIVIWNPSTGSAAQAANVRSRLQKIANVTIREPNGREAAIREVVEVCNSGVDFVVAAGGDGTISSVVEGLMKSDRRPILGILPLGTGNDFARTLDIPLDFNDAFDVVRSGDVREIDSVRFTSSDGARWYANMLTGGNTGRYLEHMTDEFKQRWGPFCYLRGTIELIQDLQVYQIEVTCDQNRSEAFDALNVFVANGRMSGGGLAVSPEAEIDDGLVDVVVIRDGQFGEIAKLTTEYFVADYLEHPLVAFRRARHVVIESEPPLPLTADGEHVGETRLTVEVQAECLRVVAPAALAG